MRTAVAAARVAAARVAAAHVAAARVAAAAAHPPPAWPPIAQLPPDDHESALLVSTLPLVGVAVALLFGAGCLMLWCKERAHTIPNSGIMQSNDEYRRQQQRRREQQLRRYRAQRYPDGVGDRRSSRRSQGGDARPARGGQLSTAEHQQAEARRPLGARRSSRERRLRVEPSGGAPPRDAELEPAIDLELTAVSAARRAIKADDNTERDDAPERPKGAALQRARAHQERVRQRLAIERRERRAAEIEAAREPGHAPAAAAEEEEGAAARLPDVDLELTSDEDESSTHSSGGRSGGHSSSGGEASGSAEAEAAAAEARALVTGCANGVRDLLDDRLAAAPPAGWAEMGRREYPHTSES